MRLRYITPFAKFELLRKSNNYYSILAFQIYLIFIQNLDIINKVKSDFENKIIQIEISEENYDKNCCCR